MLRTRKKRGKRRREQGTRKEKWGTRELGTWKGFRNACPPLDESVQIQVISCLLIRENRACSFIFACKFLICKIANKRIFQFLKRITETNICFKRQIFGSNSLQGNIAGLPRWPCHNRNKNIFYPLWIFVFSYCCIIFMLSRSSKIFCFSDTILGFSLSAGVF